MVESPTMASLSVISLDKRKIATLLQKNRFVPPPPLVWTMVVVALLKLLPPHYWLSGAIKMRVDGPNL